MEFLPRLQKVYLQPNGMVAAFPGSLNVALPKLDGGCDAGFWDLPRLWHLGWRQKIATLQNARPQSGVGGYSLLESVSTRRRKRHAAGYVLSSTGHSEQLRGFQSAPGQAP